MPTQNAHRIVRSIRRFRILELGNAGGTLFEKVSPGPTFKNFFTIAANTCREKILIDYFLFLFGTGSYPPRQKGLQRRIRQAPSAMPIITPHSCIASSVYCEQDGVKRQERGRAGEIYFW